VFSRGANSGEVRVALDFARCRERWLFEPEIEFRFGNVQDRAMRTREEATSPPVRLHVAVTISPSRIAAHAMAREVNVRTASWQEVLISDQATVNRVAEYSAKEGQDNVLPSLAYAEPQLLTDVIEEAEVYVAKVEAFLEHLVGCPISASRPFGAWFAPTSAGWTVRQAETYWEFGHVGAIEFVTRLRPVLWSIAGNMRERSWSNEDNEEMAGYTMRATKHVRIAIYAKTVDRIRLEVRNTSAVTGSLNDPLSARLRDVVEGAVGRANQARNAILARMEETDSHPSLAENVDALRELVCTLANAYRGDPDRAGDVLRELLVRGGLRTRGQEFLVDTREARRLVQLRVVDTSRFAQPSRTENFYPIAARYYSLFERFHGSHAAPVRPLEALGDV
jgi:hypothetical protein